MAKFEQRYCATNYVFWDSQLSFFKYVGWRKHIIETPHVRGAKEDEAIVSGCVTRAVYFAEYNGPSHS